MSKLAGKVAIVTGASKGIGAGIATGLAAAGAAVVVNYAANKASAERVVDDIKRGGGKAVAIQGDVSKSADVKRLFEATKDAFGSLDVLVNNAGVFQFDALEAVTEDEFHREFNTNVLGPILATRESLKYFGPKGGSVINISSIASEARIANAVVYAASKSAVDSITRALSKELGARKIRVNSIAPGPVATEALREQGMLESDFVKGMISNTPLERIGEPDDIARVAVFLASDEAQWLTGERIAASGGYR